MPRNTQILFLALQFTYYFYFTYYFVLLFTNFNVATNSSLFILKKKTGTEKANKCLPVPKTKKKALFPYKKLKKKYRFASSERKWNKSICIYLNWTAEELCQGMKEQLLSTCCATYRILSKIAVTINTRCTAALVQEYVQHSDRARTAWHIKMCGTNVAIMSQSKCRLLPGIKHCYLHVHRLQLEMRSHLSKW